MMTLKEDMESNVTVKAQFSCSGVSTPGSVGLSLPPLSSTLVDANSLNPVVLLVMFTSVSFDTLISLKPQSDPPIMIFSWKSVKFSWGCPSRSNQLNRRSLDALVPAKISSKFFCCPFKLLQHTLHHSERCASRDPLIALKAPPSPQASRCQRLCLCRVEGRCGRSPPTRSLMSVTFCDRLVLSMRKFGLAGTTGYSEHRLRKML